MSNLVQTATQQAQNIYPPIGMHQFNDGGVSEITPAENAEILSMEDFLLAEDRLNNTSNVASEFTPQHSAEILQLFGMEHGDGSNISTPLELQTAHVNHISDVSNARDNTIFNYSVGDTAKEQNGASSSDDNLSTAGGHLKRGITDPDAYKQIEKEKREKRRSARMFNEQELLTQYLKQLDAEIGALKEKINEYNEQISEMDDILNVLESGDINANSSSGRARREKLKAWAKENGVNLDKFKKADGSFDQNKLQEFVAQQREEVTAQRDVAQIELNEKEQIRQDVIQKLEQNREEYHKELNSGDETRIAASLDNLERQVESASEKSFISNNEIEKIDTYTFGIKGGDIGKATIINIDEITAKQSPNVTPVYASMLSMFENNKLTAMSSESEALSTNRENGSFASQDGSSNSVISATFAIASNPNINNQHQQNTQEDQPHTLTNQVASYGV